MRKFLIGVSDLSKTHFKVEFTNSNSAYKMSLKISDQMESILTFQKCLIYSANE